REPRLIAASREIAEELGLREEDLGRSPLLESLAGNRLLPGMKPYAACYGGHQFGNWAGQLGDGRAITLGELLAPSGARYEVQLKGAGRTPYSRTADGRAVLRSSVREFLCSEAMHHLGVPTTRALSLVTTGEEVLRDVLYSGHPAMEPGAIVARVAPSFLRFGNLEILASRGEHELLQKLVDHALRWHFPELQGHREPTRETYIALLQEVARRTAELFAHFMRVGFVHGVLNTDNMSLLGLAIDYGPYGFLEGYDPRWTPNTTDSSGRRYAYGNQPRIGAWNIARLAEAMGPLIGEVTELERAVGIYADHFDAADRRMLAGKLGIEALRGDVDSPDGALVEELFAFLESAEIDMTIFFRRLAELPVDEDFWREPSEAAVVETFSVAFYDPGALSGARLGRLIALLCGWAARVRADGTPDAARRARMNAHNPKFVLRNWLAQQAIEASTQGDHSEIATLLDVMRRPYDEQPGRERYAEKRPEWARHRVGCSMLSCSS
ncbi:MAG: YdiU family protein, partial [Polyangiaceae bacterium]|nr:YdiU family protein [Polyangiaceae bacterium]